MNVETEIVPPDVDEPDGDDTSAMVSCHLSSSDDVGYSASAHLFGARADDPDEFAGALLGTALALAALRGPDYSWALMQQLAAYDGGAPR